MIEIADHLLARQLDAEEARVLRALLEGLTAPVGRNPDELIRQVKAYQPRFTKLK